MPTRVQLPDGNIGEFPDGMSPQQIEGVLQKQFPAQKDPGPKPQARTVGNYLSEGASGVGRGIVNDVKGLSSLRHPIDAAEGMMAQANESGEAAGKEFRDLKGVTMSQRLGATALTALENAPVVGGMVQYAEKGGERMGSPEAFGAAMEGITTFAAPEVSGKGVGKLMKKVPAVVRSATGTGPKVAADLAKETTAENVKASAKVDKTNKASAAKAEEARGVEDKRGSLQKEIHETSRELQARIETARAKALREGNEKYSAFNKKLNELPADMDNLQGAYADAAQSFGDAQSVPSLIKRLETAINGPLTYADEQKLYSDLGKELSKGNLPGTTYHAYDLLHEAVGNDMQRIADSKGMGAELTGARNYWRQMKQTFGKPYVARDAASKTLKSLSPEFAKQEAHGNAVRMLGRYDPEIVDTAGRLTAAREGLKSLPKARSTVPAVETFSPKTIGADEIRAAKTESLAARKGGIPAAVSAYRGVRSALNFKFGDALDHFAKGVTSITASRLLDNPRVIEFLTKATPEDVAQIPPELRGNIAPVIQAAQAKGIRVAPAIQALATGASVAGQPRRGIASALSIGTSQGNPGTPP